MATSNQALQSLFGIITDTADTISATTNTIGTVVLMANDQAQYMRKVNQDRITINSSTKRDQLIEDKAMEMAQRHDTIKEWANTPDRQQAFSAAQAKLTALFD